MDGDSQESEEDRKNRLWIVDPDMYHTSGRRKSLGAKVVSRLRALGALGLLSLLILFPMGLVYAGLVYGWVGFWGIFVGSVTILGLVLHRAGFSGNFREAGTGNTLRGVSGLLLAFILVAGFYEGLFVLRSWVLPIITIAFTAVLAYKLAKS